MFYIKTEHEGKEITVDLYGDEIYTKCFNCGKEFQVEEETLMGVLRDGWDFAGTSVACCSGKRPELIRIK